MNRYMSCKDCDQSTTGYGHFCLHHMGIELEAAERTISEMGRSLSKQGEACDIIGKQAEHIAFLESALETAGAKLLTISEKWMDSAQYIERLKTLVVNVKLELEQGKLMRATDIILDFMVKDR